MCSIQNLVDHIVESGTMNSQTVWVLERDLVADMRRAGLRKGDIKKAITRAVRTAVVYRRGAELVLV